MNILNKKYKNKLEVLEIKLRTDFQVSSKKADNNIANSIEIFY